MLTLSTLIKELKLHSKNPSISDEEFTNEFLYPFICAGNIKNKSREEFYLDKAKTSTLLSGKRDVPTALKKALPIMNIKEKTTENYLDFIEDYLEADTFELSKTIKGLLRKAGLENEYSEIEITKTILAQILTSLLMTAIRSDNCATQTETTLWKKGVNSVSAIPGDLFKYGFENRRKKKNIVVIPVDTSFATHVTRKQENAPMQLVSENTLHGEWLTRIIVTGISEKELSNRIQTDLRNNGNVCSNDARFPIGTIAVIEMNNAIYWLLAISDFNENNVAKSSKDNIAMAIEALLDAYDKRGQGYDLYLPLVGTGRSRAGLTSLESYHLIKTVFINNKDKLQGNINIVILPETFKEVHNDLQN